MTDQQAPSETRAAEAAAIRRRWVTLGEVLAVIAVLISGLTLYNNWQERRSSETQKAAATKQGAARAATLVLTAQADRDGNGLSLKPRSDAQNVQSQTILFPKSLGVAQAETTGEPRIEASWFATALKQARAAAGKPDDSRGDERLPVGIVTRFLVDGQAHEDTALYDIGYSVAGRLIAGHRVTLRGLSLVEHHNGTVLQTALDRRWAEIMPAKR